MAATFDAAYALTCSVAPDVRSFSEAEARRYWDILCDVPRYGVVVEIGLQYGRSSSLVAQASRDIGFEHIGIDPWIDPPGARDRWLDVMHSIPHNWTMLPIRSDDPHLPDELPPEVDVALIDGDHWETAVENDINLLAPRIVPNGYLLLHDYGDSQLPNVYPTVYATFVRSKMPREGWIEEPRADTLGVWRRT